jgi:hypothetical protein
MGSGPALPLRVPEQKGVRQRSASPFVGGVTRAFTARAPLGEPTGTRELAGMERLVQAGDLDDVAGIWRVDELVTSSSDRRLQRDSGNPEGVGPRTADRRSQDDERQERSKDRSPPSRAFHEGLPERPRRGAAHSIITATSPDASRRRRPRRAGRRAPGKSGVLDIGCPRSGRHRARAAAGRWRARSTAATPAATVPAFTGDTHRRATPSRRPTSPPLSNSVETGGVRQ